MFDIATTKFLQSPSPQPPYRGTGQALSHQGRGRSCPIDRHVPRKTQRHSTLTLEDILQDREAVRKVACAGRPGIVMDFDGTLSEIVPTPDSALIEPRSARALRRLVGQFPLVAVLSGRGVRDLADRVGVGGVVCVGNHGAEYIVDGAYRVAGDAVGGATGISDILTHLKSAVTEPGVLYEDKGFSASVHFRQTSDPAHTTRLLRDSVSDAPGIERFEVFWGKRVLEIRPLRAVD